MFPSPRFYLLAYRRAGEQWAGAEVGSQQSWMYRLFSYLQRQLVGRHIDLLALLYSSVGSTLAEVRAWLSCSCFLLGVTSAKGSTAVLWRVQPSQAMWGCHSGAMWQSLYCERMCHRDLSENIWHSLGLNQLQNGKSSTSEMSLNAYEYLNSSPIIEGGGEK